MMTPEQLDILQATANDARETDRQRTRRRIEQGTIPGKILSNGSHVIFGTKGIQNWYSTKELVAEVTERFARSENLDCGRKCKINGKHLLQIRGKHLRRLLKAMPNVRQEGRYLVDKG